MPRIKPGLDTIKESLEPDSEAYSPPASILTTSDDDSDASPSPSPSPSMHSSTANIGAQFNVITSQTANEISRLLSDFEQNCKKIIERDPHFSVRMPHKSDPLQDKFRETVNKLETIFNVYRAKLKTQFDYGHEMSIARQELQESGDFQRFSKQMLTLQATRDKIRAPLENLCTNETEKLEQCRDKYKAERTNNQERANTTPSQQNTNEPSSQLAHDKLKLGGSTK